jgi:hypothetical protein
MQAGQRVVWSWYPEGPRGPSEDVPAVIVRVTPKRVLIEVPLRESLGAVRRWAKPEHIREEQYADEQMTLLIARIERLEAERRR